MAPAAERPILLVAAHGERGGAGDNARLASIADAAGALLPGWDVRHGVLSGKPAGMHGIQGLGAGFVPEIVDRSVIDEVAAVSDVAAERMARRLAREEGLLVGPSSGANVHAACELAKTLPKDSKVVTILCDSGERYLF